MTRRESAADSESRDVPARGEEWFFGSGARWGLFGLFNLCAAMATTIAWASDERQWLALAIAVVLGAYLGVFAAAWRTEGQAVPRTRTILERLQAVPDWAIRVTGLSGVALAASPLLGNPLGFGEAGTAAGFALMGLMWLAGPRPFRFRR